VFIFSSTYFIRDAIFKMNEDLRRERSRTSFDTKELSAILYAGEENHSALKRLGM
jgi:hypothetical protein